jgi:hypothetical protein
MALKQKHTPWHERWPWRKNIDFILEHDKNINFETCSLLKIYKHGSHKPHGNIKSREIHYVIIPKAEPGGSRI